MADLPTNDIPITDMYDEMDTRDPELRERNLFVALPEHLETAVTGAPGLARHLEGQNLTAITDRTALATLPVLRKSDLMKAQQTQPPFGDFAVAANLTGTRVFVSPGPVWEPQGLGADPWSGARALYAAGFRSDDMVHNALSYHATPGGFILDEALRALGCTVFPAGVGGTEQQVQAANHFGAVAYTGTPDYLKVMLDKADETGIDLSSIKRAMVSGGALFPSMREEYRERGVDVMQSYATADLGVIAYETKGPDGLCDGMIVNEGLIVEILRPGTGDPVAPGEVGELVVTNFSKTYPLVRFATGDLSAVLDEPSPCGRTNMRIKGWMGRADQRTKVKGMFVDPKQVADIISSHAGASAGRLIVSRDGASDSMHLQVTGSDLDAEAIASSIRTVTGLSGTVELVDALPNDGKVIDDTRDYEA
ncbi:phenylacetate--CoA ligase family protein [Ahrensia sp. R2A130]|uniref:phenylacetate--CoA ligase family protein n=1 Tax=Ahrensia sp. R2A130 TaxID=744979 RepID=UPI0001E0C36A|nr:AMP-binding protein [Ahrensia sp. R2A130]EFL88780.1 coenzyme F390 synthetase [Ahrensia sp. R2A130]